MTITLEELKQKYTELGAMIKAYEEQQEETEFPREGDLISYIDIHGMVRPAIFRKRYYGGMLAFGNIFRTREEAEFAAERLKVLAELKRCGGKIKYKRSTCCGEASSFFIKYFDGEISVCSVDSFWAATKMWFPTEEAAQKAIDTIGEERLLKYWFCVEVKE